MVMIPLELAQAASAFAEGLGGNLEAFAESAAHIAAAKSWADLAKGGGGASERGKSGGGRNKRKNMEDTPTPENRPGSARIIVDMKDITSESLVTDVPRYTRRIIEEVTRAKDRDVTLEFV
jgi:hypothetical protein